MSDDLDTLRQAIDALDEALLKQLNERAKLAQQVAEAKQRSQSNSDEPLAFYRPEREAQVLRRIAHLNEGPIPDEKVMYLFRQVMSACLSLEQPLKVGYLGPEGTFTHQAAIKHFGYAAVGMPLVTVDEIFREVAAEACQYGVVPVENSTEGSVSHTLDTFVNSSLKICGECELQVHHNFMVSSEGLIERIYAHEQTFGQCRKWLDSHYPNAERIVASSNAQGARLAKEDASAGAIAAEVAAELYGLRITAKKIEDSPENTTRFLVIGQESVGASGEDKTSIMVSTRNRPGALYELLEPFHRHGISLTALESRPSKTAKWSYVFFIDFEGHVSDPAVAAVLEEIQKGPLEVKLLGSYPKALSVSL
jgi:chorismate mutase/prephenate dehydratase